MLGIEQVLTILHIQQYYFDRADTTCYFIAWLGTINTKLNLKIKKLRNVLHFFFLLPLLLFIHIIIIKQCLDKLHAVLYWHCIPVDSCKMHIRYISMSAWILQNMNVEYIKRSLHFIEKIKMNGKNVHVIDFWIRRNFMGSLASSLLNINSWHRMVNSIW